jgi:hypothetical protein
MAKVVVTDYFERLQAPQHELIDTAPRTEIAQDITAGRAAERRPTHRFHRVEDIGAGVVVPPRNRVESVLRGGEQFARGLISA